MNSHAETQVVKVSGMLEYIAGWRTQRCQETVKNKDTKEGYITDNYARKDGNQGGHITTLRTLSDSPIKCSHAIWAWPMFNLSLGVFPLCGLVHLWVAKGLAPAQERCREVQLGVAARLGSQTGMRTSCRISANSEYCCFAVGGKI